MQVKHYIVKDTGDPVVDRTDVVDRGWGELWTEFCKVEPCLHFTMLRLEDDKIDQISVDRTAGGHRPPDTVIGVASLAKSDILYECEVWAVVN